MFLSMSPPHHCHCHFLLSVSTIKLPNSHQHLSYSYYGYRYSYNAAIAGALPLTSTSSSSSPNPPNPRNLQKASNSAIKRISDKLRQLRYIDPDPETDSKESESGSGSESGPVAAGEIFIPTPHDVPIYRVGSTIDSSWATPHNPVPQPGSGPIITRSPHPSFLHNSHPLRYLNF